MQSFQWFQWFKRGLLVLSVGTLSPLASAYIQYNYSTGPLDWKATYSQGRHHTPASDIESISFGFSFQIDESKLSKSTSTLVSINEADVIPVKKFRSPHDQGVYEFKPKVRGRIEINPNKTIKYWYLLFDMKGYDLRRQAQHNQAMNSQISLGSFGGTNTCNCDIFQERFYSSVQQQDHWTRATYLDQRYGKRSSFDNWTITAKVPEANGLALAVIGLLGLVFARRKVGKHS